MARLDDIRVDFDNDRSLDAPTARLPELIKTERLIRRTAAAMDVSDRRAPD